MGNKFQYVHCHGNDFSKPDMILRNNKETFSQVKYSEYACPKPKVTR